MKEEKILVRGEPHLINKRIERQKRKSLMGVNLIRQEGNDKTNDMMQCLMNDERGG